MAVSNQFRLLRLFKLYKNMGMKSFTFLFSLVLSIFWIYSSGQGVAQRQVKSDTDANSGQRYISTWLIATS